MSVSKDDPEEQKNLNIVGENLPRLEGVEKVTGEAKYIDDYQPEDCLYGRTVRSPEPRGKIKAIKFTGDIPWEEFVIVRPADIPGENIVAMIKNEIPFLAEEEVKYPGEPLALIAHEDEQLVDKALEQVEVVIDTEGYESMFTIEEARSGKNIQRNDDNVLSAYTVDCGNMEEGWDEADVVIENDYRTQAQEHLYIEPQGLMATADPDGQLTIQGSFQCPYYIHNAMTSLFDRDSDSIRVVQTTTGGAFGGKEDYPSIFAGHAALLSHKAGGRTVKMVYGREEDMLATTKRHPSRSYVRAGFKEDGTLVALEMDFYLNGGAYPTLTSTVLSRGVLHAFGPYNCPNVDLRSKAYMTNSTPFAAFRGFGAPQSIFATELLMDEAAEELGLDPAELRRQNFLKQGDEMPTGQEIKEELDLEALMDRALEKIDYHEKKEQFKQFNQENETKKKGISLSVFFHGSGFTGGGEEELASRVAVEATEDKPLEVLVANVEYGQGIHTGFTQIAAETCNLPPHWVEISEPDTARVPDSGPTVASRSTMIVGRLIEDACEELIEELQEKVGLAEDFSAEEYQEATREYLAQYGELRAELQYHDPPEIHWDEESYTGEAYSGYAWSCDVAEVEVDFVDYRTQVTDFVSTVECGRLVNPDMAAAQIEGGVVQALGYALYEDVIMEKGMMKNHQYSNYIIPTAADVPEVDVEFIEFPFNNYGPYFAKGIGELPFDGPAPAIAGAVARALDGNYITKIPLLPETLLDALSNTEVEN